MSRDLMDVMIRIGIIAIVVVMCARIIAPFAGLMLWAVILAVALYPLHRRFAKRLGGRQGYAAILLVIAGLLVIGLPTVMLGSSFAGYVHEAFTVFRDKPITIKQPDAAVADWPLIGETVYNTWSSAATDLPAFLEGKKPQLEKLSKRVLSAAASTAGGVILFLGALIVAGIIMIYGESGSQTTQRILNRLAGPEKGPRLHRLSTATIRSVAMGVIGVAFIQALLLGIGFILADIPAAGLLALVVLL
ncbi:MAG: AI-2E family transporter, partial [Halobacteria archaeon]|nr:AI-2E family transporter [Halobacteria archaeon]